MLSQSVIRLPANSRVGSLRADYCLWSCEKSNLKVNTSVPSSWVATTLDALMLNGRIADAATPDASLPVRPGTEVAAELAGRMLLRYTADVRETARSTPTFVCPTPLSSDEVGHWLNLPRRDLERRYVLFLNPQYIGSVQGPRWCNMGQGIEYILPDGYTEVAIHGMPWVVEVR